VTVDKAGGQIPSPVPKMKKSSRLQPPIYSYKQIRTEEKKIYKRLFLLFGIIVVTIVILWFWGITFIQIIGGLSNSGSGNDLASGLQLPLLKPTISALPEFTNNEKITISGFTNANTKLTLFLNGIESGKTNADINGNYTFVDVSLKDGLNFIKITTELDGEIKEEKALITLDQKPPTLQITEPKDKDVVIKTSTINVKGQTDPDAKVYVNSIQATLDKNGTFTFVLGASPGENKIVVEAKDKAGNSKKVELTITVKDQGP